MPADVLQPISNLHNGRFPSPSIDHGWANLLDRDTLGRYRKEAPVQGYGVCSLRRFEVTGVVLSAWNSVPGANGSV